VTTKETGKSKSTNKTARGKGAKAKGGGRRSTAGSRRPAQAGKGHAPARAGSAPRDGEARRVALAIADEGLDKKAQNVEIIDVHGMVDYADYVVVMSGRSDRQVNAIARGIEQGLQQKSVARCLGVEGLPQGNWVLMDFGDVVVHIFHQDTRGYYDLESLWIDAARVSPADG